MGILFDYFRMLLFPSLSFSLLYIRPNAGATLRFGGGAPVDARRVAAAMPEADLAQGWMGLGHARRTFRAATAAKWLQARATLEEKLPRPVRAPGHP